MNTHSHIFWRKSFTVFRAALYIIHIKPISPWQTTRVHSQYGTITSLDNHNTECSQSTPCHIHTVYEKRPIRVNQLKTLGQKQTSFTCERVCACMNMHAHAHTHAHTHMLKCVHVKACTHTQTYTHTKHSLSLSLSFSLGYTEFNYHCNARKFDTWNNESGLLQKIKTMHGKRRCKT